MGVPSHVYIRMYFLLKYHLAEETSHMTRMEFSVIFYQQTCLAFFVGFFKSKITSPGSPNQAMLVFVSLTQIEMALLANLLVSYHPTAKGQCITR